MAQIATPRPRPYAWGLVTYLLIVAAGVSILTVQATMTGTVAVLVAFGFGCAFSVSAWAAWRNAQRDARTHATHR